MSTPAGHAGGKRAYWAELTRRDFAGLDLTNAIAVLPVGAIEQHGPHLPVSVDIDLVNAVIARTLPLVDTRLTVLFLPDAAYGKSNEHIAFPGTLSISAATLMRFWTEIGESVARTGIRRFVLFNGHGGNTPAMEIVARDLRVAHGMRTASCSWYQFNEAESLVGTNEHVLGLHAGDVETSAMLACSPERVDMRQAKNFVSAEEGWRRTYRYVGAGGATARLGWRIDDLNGEGACGNAAAATAEKGQALLARAATNFAAFISEFDRFCREIEAGKGEAR